MKDWEISKVAINEDQRQPAMTSMRIRYGILSGITTSYKFARQK